MRRRSPTADPQTDAVATGTGPTPDNEPSSRLPDIGLFRGVIRLGLTKIGVEPEEAQLFAEAIAIGASAIQLVNVALAFDDLATAIRKNDHMGMISAMVSLMPAGRAGELLKLAARAGGKGARPKQPGAPNTEGANPAGAARTEKEPTAVSDANATLEQASTAEPALTGPQSTERPSATEPARTSAPERAIAPDAGAAPAQSRPTAKEQIAANKAAGAAFEKNTLSTLEQLNLGVGPQITLRTRNGVRTRLDFLTRDPLTGKLDCTECKASATARLTPNQTLAIPEIARSGATIVGAGKPGFPCGMKIPRVNVKIIRDLDTCQSSKTT